MSCTASLRTGIWRKLSTAARYQEELERKEFYLIDTKIEQVATGLGLTAIGLDRPIEADERRAEGKGHTGEITA